MNHNNVDRSNEQKRKIDKEYKMGKKYFKETRKDDSDMTDKLINHNSLRAFTEFSEEFLDEKNTKNSNNNN